MTESALVENARFKEYLRECVHLTPVPFADDQPFVRKHENGRRIRCVLCSTDWMSMDVSQNHFRSYEHRAVFNRFREVREEKWNGIQKNRRVTIEKYRVRSNAIVHSKWKRHAKSLLLDYLYSSTADEEFSLELARSTLTKYEKMEKLSVLELAILKAARGTVVEDDAQASFHDLRITCGLQVIIPLVKTFLGDAHW